MAIAKAAVAVVGVVGVATATTIALVSSSGMPEWRPLSEDSTSTYTGKYVEHKIRFFVGVTSAAKDGSKYKNVDHKVWWDWAFSNKYGSYSKDIKSDKFKKEKIKKGDDLKGACKSAYETETASVKSEPDTNIQNTEFLAEEVWAFCSPLGQEPVTLDKATDAEKTQYKTKLGAETDQQTKFVSIDDPKNALFWEIKQEEFYAGDAPSDNDAKFFKALYDTNKTTKPKDSLKEKCRAAYKLEKEESTSTKDKPKKDEVLKYCTLTGQTS